MECAVLSLIKYMNTLFLLTKFSPLIMLIESKTD